MRRPGAARGTLKLRLYVAGNAPNSLRAIANIKAACEQHFPMKYALEIVDLVKNPLRAQSDQVVVTPTLIRLQPKPTLRLIGSLSDASQLLFALGST
jgi:circadian clock protein KaiB